MLTPKQVAELFGVCNETVRNWDRRGIIKADFVTESGKKRYSEEQIMTLYNSCNVRVDRGDNYV